MQPQQFVAYYRVSTQKQGQSGLGLEAQRAACAAYAPIAEYVEIESGKNDDRSQLHAARAFAKSNNAILIVAKLDRLSRKASFIMGLMDEGFRFRCADMPNADEFQLHLFAILAQKERKMISDRTKAALSAAKERGVKLGGVQAGLRKEIDQFDADIHKHVQSIIDSGITSATSIAKALNDRAVRSRKGGLWQAVQVQRVLKRIQEKE